jgi:hypothetical protein
MTSQSSIVLTVCTVYIVPSTTHIMPSTTHIMPSTTHIVPNTTHIVPSTAFATVLRTVFIVPNTTHNLLSPAHCYLAGSRISIYTFQSPRGKPSESIGEQTWYGVFEIVITSIFSSIFKRAIDSFDIELYCDIFLLIVLEPLITIPKIYNNVDSISENRIFRPTKNDSTIQKRKKNKNKILFKYTRFSFVTMQRGLWNV